MSTEREELARIIMSPESFDGGPASCGPNDVYAARIADAIIAAGYRKPRTIATVNELDTLPVGSVIRSEDRSYLVAHKEDRAEGYCGWAAAGTSSTPRDLPTWLPVTVLHEPEVSK